MTVTELPVAFQEFCRPMDLVANTPEWEQERGNGLGASDMSAVLGLNPYQDRHGLWMVKVMGVHDPVNWRMRIGHALEPVVREKFEEDTGLVVSQHGMVQSISHPFLRYTPDGFTSDGGLFEAKTTSWYLADQWADDQTADHAEIQVQAGMFVTGARHAWVAAMIDANPDRFEVRRVERDDEFIADMLATATFFWEHYVQGHREPPLSAQSLQWAKDHYVDNSGEPVDIGDEGLQLLREMNAAKAEIKKLKSVVDEKEAMLRERIGDGNVIQVGELTLGTRKPVTTRSLNQKELSADLLEHGIDLDDYRTEKTSARIYWKKGVA